MNIQETRTELGGAPARMLYAGLPELAGARGTVLFFHGLGASKEDHTKELRSLAQAGFLAVGLDNVGHGDRKDPELADVIAPEEDMEYWSRYIDAVHQTALEVPGVVADLLTLGVSRPWQIGAAGISMGGAIAYAAPLAERRIQAITPIVARPRWWPDSPASPHHFRDKFFPVAVLSQTGGADDVVPPEHAREFHEGLADHYAQAPHRLAYVEYDGAGHEFPGPQWEEAWAKVLAWFGRYLRREQVVRGF